MAKIIIYIKRNNIQRKFTKIIVLISLSLFFILYKIIVIYSDYSFYRKGFKGVKIKFAISLRYLYFKIQLI